MRTKFRQVVSQLAQDIKSGDLKPGDRLPTHRELAYRFGLSLGTATRVFAELDAMGLTVGEVGRGTFVRMNGDARAVDFSLSDPAGDFVDFGRNRLVLPEQDEIFRNGLQNVLGNADCDTLDYRNNAGSAYDRRMIWYWLNEERAVPIFGHEALTICSGGQHALMLALLAACHPGDCVAVEELTYPVVRLACEMLHLDVVTVQSDAQGICPQSLDQLCREAPVRLLFCMPNMQNPTSVTMPLERRTQIAGLLKEHDIYALEDDAYGFLLKAPPMSLSELAPDHVFYSRTLSKSWAPGLRICYLASPEKMLERVDKAQRSTVWMTAPLMASLATYLVRTGQYGIVIGKKRREIAKRQAILGRVFDGMALQTDPASMHVLLPAPDTVRTGALLEALEKVKVIASPISQFAAGDDIRARPMGIRLCIGAPQNRMLLEDGLRRIRTTITALQDNP
ncbi:PLP-dependent aminotransferase family protein [uncultured Cohaesibacter sp.]|uniref:aminotransferase-like domain-containing protein n=1 Tax=uncultured Cohaesibacter sp. TaxID=1002546 RepID=UPI00292F7DCC|nr:PLP-dependent aminotransferase family protein [uncultured Cohaesibacter sp.]